MDVYEPHLLKVGLLQLHHPFVFAKPITPLPSIQADLGFSQENLQWVISAYALVFGGFLLLGGRLTGKDMRHIAVFIGVLNLAAVGLATGERDQVQLRGVTDLTQEGNRGSVRREPRGRIGGPCGEAASPGIAGHRPERCSCLSGNYFRANEDDHGAVGRD